LDIESRALALHGVHFHVKVDRHRVDWFGESTEPALAALQRRVGRLRRQIPRPAGDVVTAGQRRGPYFPSTLSTLLPWLSRANTPAAQPARMITPRAAMAMIQPVPRPRFAGAEGAL
jgi:hypothetical protein